MVKRILCRVVRTKALGKSSNALRHPSPVRSPWAGSRNGAYRFTSNGASTSNNAYHKSGDVVTRPPKSYKSASGTLTYTELLEITRVSIDDGLTGQILDCYA